MRREDYDSELDGPWPVPCSECTKIDCGTTECCGGPECRCECEAEADALLSADADAQDRAVDARVDAGVEDHLDRVRGLR